jgi:hypothetical protein
MNGTFWPEPTPYVDPKQLQIEFFWPLTEQIPLDLDFSQCSPHQYYLRAKGVAGTEGPFPTGMLYTSGGTTWADPSPSLVVQAGDADGYFKIGNLHIAQKKPNLIRKLVYKLLGFNWEKK